MSSIFPFQNNLLDCSFSIQGFFNKIPVLYLQIQGVFKEKVNFKEFSRTQQFFLEYSRPVQTICHEYQFALLNENFALRLALNKGLWGTRK